MKSRIGALACLMVLVGGYAAWGTIGARVSEFPEARILPPAAGLAPEVAALSGVWEADGSSGLLNRVVIERIHANWATVVYGWADHPTGAFKAGWARVRAKVLPGGQLQWGFPARFTIKIVNGGLSIEGKREQAGKISTFTLRKAGLMTSR